MYGGALHGLGVLCFCFLAHHKHTHFSVHVLHSQVRAQGMELAVPGTYIAGEPLVTIAAFAPQLQVISSKQRPRKLTIHGGDGAEYMFLLKGHEVGC
jgi:phosphatidylinositol kinase/protein kinase (PI-3  family)